MVFLLNPSMVIYDLDLQRSALGPLKPYPIALVYTDAVLSLSIAKKRFESVSRWNPKIIQSFNRIQLIKLAYRYWSQLIGTNSSCSSGVAAVENVL